MIDLSRLLACPFCRTGLDFGESEWVCSSCSRSYALRNGAINFLCGEAEEEARLDSTDGRAMVHQYRAPNRLKKLARQVITSEFFPGKGWRRAKARALNERPCLILGSGVTRYEGAVHLDLDDFPGVDVIASGQNLPFRDASFDAVVSEVVLEHVARPGAVIDEIHRVLRPGGRFFVTVPFLFPFHGHPGDYHRWSREGLGQAFRAFDELDLGIHGGPTSAVVNILTEWVYTMSGMRFPKGYTPIKGIATAVLFPLKFLDLIANRLPEAHRLAATLYAAGIKPERRTDN